MKCCVLIGAVVFGVSTAYLQAGEIITFNFTGEVSHISDTLNIFPDVLVGDPVAGSYSYDTNAADDDPDPGNGVYIAGNLTVQIGTWTFQSDASGSTTVTVENRFSDRLEILNFGSFTPKFVFPGIAEVLFVQFYDVDGTALSSDALPVAAPVLSEYEEASGAVGYLGAADPFFSASSIGFDITSVSQEQREACCLTDNTCKMVNAISCADTGGEPGGPGSTCLGIEACCLPGDSCDEMDAHCCLNEGGTPLGPGTVCAGTVSCIFPDESCVELDVYCCDSYGGEAGNPGSTCGPPPLGIPTVSQWGIVAMALLLLIGARVYFSRQRTIQA